MDYQIIISDRETNVKARLKTYVPIKDAGYWQKRIGELVSDSEYVTVGVAMPCRDFAGEALAMTNKMYNILGQKGVVQASVTPIYTAMILLSKASSGGQNYSTLFDWATINLAITTKWSKSGMVRIKEAAWKGVE